MAGSALARLHGHERRHAHQEQARALGDKVVATIDSQLVTWANNYAGPTGDPAPAPATSTAETTAPAPAPTSTDEPATSTISVVSASSSSSSSSSSTFVTSSVPTASSAPSGNADWTATPANGQFSTEGFGARTSSSGTDVNYKGNIGSPWGSNIIEVSPDQASNYKHVTQFKGSNVKPWTLVFWNKMGLDGKLDGWYGQTALKLSLHPGETKYVAYDDDSQGGWAAAEGDEVPKDLYGGWAATWGEFDFSSSANNGWSGWDVSAIQAQKANKAVQGMKICDHLGEKCSVVGNGGSQITNAYSAALANVNGIGGNQGGQGPIRLTVEIDFA